MQYFDGRVIIFLLLIGAGGVIGSLVARKFALASLFAGTLFLSLHIATAALAVKDRIEDLEASIKDGTLHSASGFAALPQWWFDFTVKIGFAFLALSLVLFILSKTGVGRKASSKIDKLRTRSIKGYSPGSLKNQPPPSDINWGDPFAPEPAGSESSIQRTG